MARATKPTTPKPVKVESRNCFGIAYYATEAEADQAAKLVREAGHTYNGGFYHGISCGRDTGFDHVDRGQQLFAVTTR